MSASAAPRMGHFLFGERPQPGYARSFALAFGVHALLLAILFLGVRVQSHAPQSVSVELWEPPPPAVRVEPPKVPPKVEPEPPKPEPKLEKPDIVEKPIPKKPEPKKPEPKKPEAKKPEPKVDTKASEAEFQRQLREQLAREQAASQDRQMRDAAAREQLSAKNRALGAWIAKIQAKIRSNVNLPADVVGNPQAIFDVSLLPTGEVLTVKLKKSSGSKALDEAVERAILKSSPLPRPDDPSVFDRRLELTYRPQDK